MSRDKKSLRTLFEKWFGLGPTVGVRVVDFGCMNAHSHERYVRVEASRGTDVLTLFFFRHEDGGWYVFPPSSDRDRSRLKAATLV